MGGIAKAEYRESVVGFTFHLYDREGLKECCQEHEVLAILSGRSAPPVNHSKSPIEMTHQAFSGQCSLKTSNAKLVRLATSAWKCLQLFPKFGPSYQNLRLGACMTILVNGLLHHLLVAGSVCKLS